MRPKEVLQPSGVRLVRLWDTPPKEGSEKWVFKMSDGVNTVAAKVFKTNQDIEGTYTRTRGQRIQEEINGNRLLRTTSLVPYIPQFLYPLSDERRRKVGIAVHWEEGVSLSRMMGLKIITAREVDVLEEAFFTAVDNGYYPDDDLFELENINFNPNRSPRLWLSESGMAPEDAPWLMPNSYVSMMRAHFEEIRQFVKS